MVARLAPCYGMPMLYAHLIKRPNGYWYIQWKREGEARWKRLSTRARSKPEANQRLREFIRQREAESPG